MKAALYIDPGTGSMLFTIFIGILSGILFLWKKFVLKLKFIVGGGRVKETGETYPYVIFSDSKRYWNVFKPVCDEFEKRGIELEYMTASPDDPGLKEVYKHVHATFIGEGNKAFARLNFLRADVLLSTTPGLEVYQWKRSPYVKYYVHIFHAVDEGLGYRMFGMDYYDAILLTGEFQARYIRMLEKMRHLPAKDLCVTGSVYMDELKKKHDADTVRSHEGIRVLLAPSWGKSAILSRYGSEIIKELVKTGFHITIRPHPQSLVSEKEIIEPLQREFPDSDTLSWNYDNDNYRVLADSDIMITDFSGIIFDFSLVFDKPVIYADTSFDTSVYDAAWVNEPLWRFQALKDLGKPLERDDLPRIKEVIEGLVNGPSTEAGIEKIRNTAWECRGESAEKTVDYLVGKHEELLSKRDGK